MTSNFDRDIKNIPVFGSLKDKKKVRRALTLSNAANGSGVKGSTANREWYQ